MIWRRFSMPSLSYAVLGEGGQAIFVDAIDTGSRLPGTVLVRAEQAGDIADRDLFLEVLLVLSLWTQWGDRLWRGFTEYVPV